MREESSVRFDVRVHEDSPTLVQSGSFQLAGRHQGNRHRRSLVDEIENRPGLLSRADRIEQVAKALGPGNGREHRRLAKARRLDLFREFRNHGGDVVQTGTASRIADKVERGGFRRRHVQNAGRRVSRLDRYASRVLPVHEFDTDLAAPKRTAWLGHNHLERLGTLVRGAVILGGGKKTRVIILTRPAHQFRNELLRGKTPQRPEFRRDDDVKPSGRHGNHPFFFGDAARRPEWHSPMNRLPARSPEGGSKAALGRQGRSVFPELRYGYASFA